MSLTTEGCAVGFLCSPCAVSVFLSLFKDTKLFYTTKQYVKNFLPMSKKVTHQIFCVIFLIL